MLCCMLGPRAEADADSKNPRRFTAPAKRGARNDAATTHQDNPNLVACARGIRVLCLAWFYPAPSWRQGRACLPRLLGIHSLMQLANGRKC